MNIKVLMQSHFQSLAPHLMSLSHPFSDLCVCRFCWLAFVLNWLSFWDRVLLWSPCWLQTLDSPAPASWVMILQVCITMINAMHDRTCYLKSWQNEPSAHSTEEHKESINTGVVNFLLLLVPISSMELTLSIASH